MVGSNLPIQPGGNENNGDGVVFNYDSTGVRFGQYFWLIGGTNQVNLVWTSLRNKNSYLWSIQKKKWITGPKYPDLPLTFSYACPIVLNSTVILFIGLIMESDYFDDVDGPPKYTVTYDFETKAWLEQDSLDFFNDKKVVRYEKNTACVMEKSKNSSRLVRSYLQFEYAKMNLVFSGY